MNSTLTLALLAPLLAPSAGLGVRTGTPAPPAELVCQQDDRLASLRAGATTARELAEDERQALRQAEERGAELEGLRAGDSDASTVLLIAAVVLLAILIL